MNIFSLRLMRALTFLADVFIMLVWPVLKVAFCLAAFFAVIVILFFLVAVF